MKDTIGSRIKYLRDRKGIDQVTLAEKAAISQAALSAIETDKSMPRGSTRIKLANALGVEPEWLRTGRGPEKISSEIKGRPFSQEYLDRMVRIAEAVQSLGGIETVALDLGTDIEDIKKWCNKPIGHGSTAIPKIMLAFGKIYSLPKVLTIIYGSSMKDPKNGVYQNQCIEWAYPGFYRWLNEISRNIKSKPEIDPAKIKEDICKIDIPIADLIKLDFMDIPNYLVSLPEDSINYNMSHIITNTPLSIKQAITPISEWEPFSGDQNESLSEKVEYIDWVNIAFAVHYVEKAIVENTKEQLDNEGEVALEIDRIRAYQIAYKYLMSNLFTNDFNPYLFIKELVKAL